MFQDPLYYNMNIFNKMNIIEMPNDKAIDLNPPSFVCDTPLSKHFASISKFA